MKVITVENGEVVVTDSTTGKVIKPFYENINPDYEYIISNYTNIDMSDKPVDIRGYKEDIISFYKRIGDSLGCSLKRFAEMLNGAIYRAYIEPNEDLQDRFSRVYYRYTNSEGHRKSASTRDINLVKRVNEVADTIMQYIDDGQTHMAGFALITGDAQSSKKTLGKKLWKRLCKNSKTRNDKICTKVFKYCCNTNDFTSCSEVVRMANEIPSTVLLKMHEDFFFRIHKVALETGFSSIVKDYISYCNTPLYKIKVEGILKITNYILDTKNMFNTLGNEKEINNKWSIARIVREHDSAVKEVKAMRTSPKKFSSLNKLPEVITGKAFQATLVSSAREMQELGKSQKHCIGSYWKSSARGEYVAYKITDNKGKVSSLGIPHPSTKKYLNIQHYYACNESIRNINRIAFARTVVSKVQRIMVESIELSDNKNCHTVADIVPFNDIPF